MRGAWSLVLSAWLGDCLIDVPQRKNCCCLRQSVQTRQLDTHKQRASSIAIAIVFCIHPPAQRTVSLLQYFGVHDEMMTLWSERGDFMNKTLNSRSAVLNMKFACNLIKKFEHPDIPKEALRHALKALLGFMVPLMPNPAEDDASPVQPFLFDKSGKATETDMLRIATSLKDSKTWAKLDAQLTKHNEKSASSIELAEQKQKESAEKYACAEKCLDKKEVAQAVKASKLAERLKNKAQVLATLPTELKSFKKEITYEESNYKDKKPVSHTRAVQVFEDHMFNVQENLRKADGNKHPASYLAMLMEIVHTLFFTFVFKGSVEYRGVVWSKCPGSHLSNFDARRTNLAKSQCHFILSASFLPHESSIQVASISPEFRLTH